MNKQFAESLSQGIVDIEIALEEIQVELIEDPHPMADWFGVSTPTHGIIAFFSEESEAFKFRLDYISRLLNA